MISVLFDADLPERSRTGKREFQIDWEPELTVAKFLKREGFGPSERASMLAAINGEHVQMEEPLKDGDSLMVTMAIQGGGIFSPRDATGLRSAID
jgi:sulfur carrier protein ThiS